MSVRKDRGWMYKRKDAHWIPRMDGFLDFAFSNVAYVDKIKNTILCPCSQCKNMIYKKRAEVKNHLLLKGFTPNYTTWWAHGEKQTVTRLQHKRKASNLMEDDEVNGPTHTRMVLDARDPANVSPNSQVEQVPNPSAKGYYDMLANVDEPLWDGCQNYSKLQAASELFNWKSENNITGAAYDRLLSIIKRALPPREKLVGSFEETKKSLKSIGIQEIKIHVCKNHCMLFYAEDSNLTNCRVCGHGRYKSGRLSLVPHLVLRYLPIAHILQRLYMSKKTAKEMTWYFEHKKKPGLMVHPSDGEAWKHFDSMDPSFASEIRNVRLGLCTGGFSPHSSDSNSHSCWPVFLSIYNLPPWMGLNDSYVHLSMVIPGKKSPGQNLDVFLRPLVDELKMLYNDGVPTYDASRKENFTMRAMLLWTVSDFSAYGMLSGWSTHGKLACPYCMGESGSFHLEHGGKPCWFDCHRKFLPESHPYRNDKQGFLAENVVLSGPPPELTGDQIWEQVKKFPTVYEGVPYRKNNPKLPGFGSTHNWVKRSIFWELPYWQTLLIRHNLDVMHIEENVFENLINTVMGTAETKDNINARKNIKKYCNRVELHTWKMSEKDMKPKASYTLSKQQVGNISEWLTNIKFPDGFMSNFEGCLSLEDRSICSFESHECHVFMQRLLPICLKGMIPNSIWDVITELCTFFRAICLRVLHMEDLVHLQKSIVETICKLEKIFPLGFFDSMVHLVLHLTREAILGGPVQYRWSYLYKRLMESMEKKIKNQTAVEDGARYKGSIVEAYVVGESSTFCSQYFEPTVDTRLHRKFRNFAPGFTGNDSRLSIFKVPSQRLFEKSGRRRLLSDAELKIAHRYILLNCHEVTPFVQLFDKIKRKEPDIDGGLADSRDHFPEWFKQHVSQESTDISQQLKDLAQGPLRHVWSHKGYFVNGYKFHTEKDGDGQLTHNAGVCVRGINYNEDECDYYGLLDEVLEVEYHGVGRCVVVLFKCTWFNTAKEVRVDSKHNLVDIKYKSEPDEGEPFALASQTEQVYYTPYPSMAKDMEDWWAVVKMKPWSIYEPTQSVSEKADDDYEEQYFQESEMLKPTILSPPNEVEEPICLVIEGEFEEDCNNGDDSHVDVSEEEDEYDNNSDDSDDDDDELNICDHPSYGPKTTNHPSYGHESTGSSLTPSKQKSNAPSILGSSDVKDYLERIRGEMREEIRQEVRQEVHQEIPKMLAAFAVKNSQNQPRNLNP